MSESNHEGQEVYFHEYCPACKHYEKNNLTKHPCNHCLDNPVNISSHKPVDFVEADN